MRRIATVALSTGLAVPLTTGPAPALPGARPAAASQDRPKPRAWRTSGGLASVQAGGTYLRTSRSVTIKGWIRDRARDGRAAAVQFRTTERGGGHTSRVYFFKTRGIPADMPFRAKYGTFFRSDYTAHLRVRECGVAVGRGHAPKCAGWQRIF